MQASNKKKRGRPTTGHKLLGTNKRFHREFPGQEPRMVEHPGPNFNSNCEIPSELKDKISNHKFPPPKQHSIFQKIWMDSIDNVTARENFKVSHLNALGILCDLFVEYEELKAFIQKNGWSYKSVGRSGVVWRFYPEVGEIKRVQAQIREYMKLLGLVLKKDQEIESVSGDDDW